MDYRISQRPGHSSLRLLSMRIFGTRNAVRLLPATPLPENGPRGSGVRRRSRNVRPENASLPQSTIYKQFVLCSAWSRSGVDNERNGPYASVRFATVIMNSGL